MKYADNTTFWFVFCKSDLLLKRMGDGLYTIPTGDTPPTEVKPWTTIHQIDVPLMDTMHVKAYTIDAPVTESATFEMCGLRASYYKLPRVLYLAVRRFGPSLPQPSSCSSTGATRCCWFMPTTSSAISSDWWLVSLKRARRSKKPWCAK